MSYDLFLYSPNAQPVNRDDLVKALATKGWSVVVTLYAENKALSSGPIANDFIRGARSAETAKQIIEHLGNEKVLEDIFTYAECGSCGVTFDQPYSDPLEEEDLREQEKIVGAEVVGYMRQAKIRYNVYGNSLSADFMVIVGEALGELAGGLLEDPQGATYVLVTGRNKKVIVTPEVKESNSRKESNDSWNNFWKQTEQNGFTVEKETSIFGETNNVIHPEKLSKSELERLLTITKKCFQDSNTMGEWLIYDYIRKKGKKFAESEGTWIASIVQKYKDPSYSMLGEKYDKIIQKYQNKGIIKTVIIVISITIVLILLLFFIRDYLGR
jgi:hypothetical protein